MTDRALTPRDGPSGDEVPASEPARPSSLGARVRDWLRRSAVRLATAFRPAMKSATGGCDVAAIARQVVARFGRSMPACRLELSAAPHVLAVRGDALRIEQVIKLLVVDALQRAPSGGEVHVRVEDAGEHVVLTVRDRGPGTVPVPDASLVDAVSPGLRSVQEAALALHVARRIVEAHDGGISFVSRLDEGSTVTVRFPHAAGPRRPGLCPQP